MNNIEKYGEKLFHEATIKLDDVKKSFQSV
jgi:hypothetical protein